jgi:Flp pilus assembly protein TadD
MPLVNAAMAHAQLAQPRLAELKLRKAIALEPTSSEANFNLGLLLAEKGDRAGAERCLRQALESDPSLAAAAHNLGVLVSDRDAREGIHWCRKAWELQSENPKYAYTLAFYLNRVGDADAARSVLRDVLRREPAHPGCYALLGELLEAKGEVSAAQGVYRRAAQNEGLPARVRAQFAAKLKVPE